MKPLSLIRPSLPGSAARTAAAALFLMAAVPAYAQIAKVNTVMNTVQNILFGVAIVVFTIALMIAGFKMAYNHAKWTEVSNIVIGGILVGAAPAIAGFLVN